MSVSSLTEKVTGITNITIIYYLIYIMEENINFSYKLVRKKNIYIIFFI